MLNKEKLIELLWQDFLLRLQADWPEKYQRVFGDYGPLPEVRPATKFAGAVARNAKKEFEKAGISISVPSKDTLHKAFQKGNFSIHDKNRTLDFYAAFAGYKDWDEFRLIKKHEATKEVAPAHNAPPLPLKPETDLPGPPPGILQRTPAYVRYLMMLFLFLSLGYLAYYQVQANKIKKLIHSVNDAEFAAYQAVPELDTSFFQHHFMPGAVNRSEIYYIIQRSIELGHRLRTPPSNKELMNISVGFIGWSTAEVTTREKWLTQWYQVQSNRDTLKYDNINEQSYLLRHDGERWLIKTNAYEGQKAVLR